MKKNIFTKIITSVILASTLMLSSCGKKDLWNSNFEEAKSIAEKKNKNIFLVFSGEDWDNNSAALKSNILNTKEFKKEIAPNYVLAIIELSQSEFAKTAINDTATEEQKKEAERIIAEYEVKERILQDYYVDSFPSIYIVSSEGYVLANIPYSETMTSTADLKANIESQKELIDTMSDAISAVRKSSGTEKAVALDALYNMTVEDYRAILTPAVAEIPTLDPENTTGLAGKYELINGYADAVEKIMRDNDIDGAVSVLTDICNSSRISNQEKQEALYTAAFMMARCGSQDYDKMTELLEKAISLEPESNMAQEIEATIQAIQNMKKTVLEMQLAE